jgi:single-stranded DNA-binding protein
MFDLNIVLIEGIVTVSLVLEETDDGLTFTRFPIRNNECGEIQVVVWSNLAESAKKYAKVGDRIRIRGRLEKGGKEIVAQSIDYLPKSDLWRIKPDEKTDL